MFRILIVRVAIYFCVVNCFSFCFAQTPGGSCAQLEQKYVPQSTPEGTYRLELEMMSQRIYCYDLPIFDSQWRARGNQIFSVPSPAQKFYNQFETYSEEDYAVIYYPHDKSAGPIFLYRDYSGWILDRTAVINNIHYSSDNSYWFAYEGTYPYLDMLKKIFKLKKGQAGGIQAYMVE